MYGYWGKLLRVDLTDHDHLGYWGQSVARLYAQDGA